MGFQVAMSGATDSKQDTGYDFDLTVIVGKNDEFNYNWSSVDNIRDQIQKQLNAWYMANKLSNTVTGSDQIFLKNDPTKVKQQAIPNVNVQIENIPTTDGTIKKIYHIQILNDPTFKLKVRLFH